MEDDISRTQTRLKVAEIRQGAMAGFSDGDIAPCQKTLKNW